MAEKLEYKIEKKIGIIGNDDGGWTKQLNLISWNGAEPKYDIRNWSADGQRMSKGITLTEEELKTLKTLIK